MEGKQCSHFIQTQRFPFCPVLSPHPSRSHPAPHLHLCPVCSFISMAWESAAAKGGWLGHSPILSLGHVMHIACPTIIPPLPCSTKKPMQVNDYLSVCSSGAPASSSPSFPRRKIPLLRLLRNLTFPVILTIHRPQPRQPRHQIKGHFIPSLSHSYSQPWPTWVRLFGSSRLSLTIWVFFLL